MWTQTIIKSRAKTLDGVIRALKCETDMYGMDDDEFKEWVESGMAHDTIIATGKEIIISEELM